MRPEAYPEWVQSACRLLEEHCEEGLTLAQLGKRMAVSPGHLQRVFKKVTGITPRAYAEAHRLTKLKGELREDQTVLAAMLGAGYNSTSRLYERSDEQLGMTPDTYRRGGHGMHLVYTLTPCPLGRLLLAATVRGVSAVYLGEEDGLMEQALRVEYPAASLERDDHQWADWVEAILAHLDGKLPHLDLPLDVRATAFQWRVWQELRKIPYGQTRSYGEIAESLGKPGGARAVGRACATNPVSIVIPCHRAVRENGEPGGYRWGLNRKRALLEQEQKD